SVMNPVSGITDSVLVEITLTGGTNPLGTFSLDDFKLIGSVTPVVSGGNSKQSDIVSSSGFSSPQNIPYLNYQEDNNLDLSNSLEIAQFTIRDGAGISDADSLPTTLNSISFSINNHDFLRRLALYDGATELADLPVTGNSISFSGLSGLSAPDDGSKTFSIRASFTTNVTDREQFSLSVSNASADSSGSA